MSTLATTNIKHPSSASNNIVLDSAGGVDLDALTVSGSAPADSVNIDASGRLLVGLSTARANFVNAGETTKLQIEGAVNISAVRTDDTAFPSWLILGKTRSTGNTIVQSGDIIGRVAFEGNDGSEFVDAAFISAEVDGTPGANDMPGRLVFSTTADGASSPTERMRITSGGNVGIGTSAPSAPLTVQSGTDNSVAAKFDGGANGTRGLVISTEASGGYNDALVRLNSQTITGVLAFSTNNTERARIDSSGHARFSQQNFTTDVSSSNYGFVIQAGSQPFINHGVTGTSLTTMYVFINGNGVVGTIRTTGSSTQYNTSSDYRLKENVEPITGAADRILQLKPCRFNFIADATTTVDGFIAHEVQEVVPEAISGDKDAVDDKGDPDYQGIDQSKLVPLLTAALQEAIGRIETLEGMVAVNNITIDEQQHQLSTLAARLTALEGA